MCVFQVQYSIFALVKPHLVPLCPALQPIQVLLNGSTALWCVSHTSQLFIISRLAEGTLYLFTEVTDEAEHTLKEWRMVRHETTEHVAVPLLAGLSGTHCAPTEFPALKTVIVVVRHWQHRFTAAPENPQS